MMKIEETTIDPVLQLMLRAADFDAKSRDQAREIVRKKIGRRIRQRRQELRATQAVLAFAIGVSREALSQYETGRAGMDYADLPHLCSVLDVPLVWLYEETASASQVATGIDSIYNSLDEHDRQTLMAVAQSLYNRRGAVPMPEPRAEPFIHRRERTSEKVSKAPQQSAGAGEENKEEDTVAKNDVDVL